MCISRIDPDQFLWSTRFGGEGTRDVIFNFFFAVFFFANDDGAGESGVRTGEALQAAEIPVGAGTRTLGRSHPPDADAGQDLVPEPSLQVQTSGQGEGHGRLGPPPAGTPAVFFPLFFSTIRGVRLGPRRAITRGTRRKDFQHSFRPVA